jgi:cholesterol transport system auxiliary component
MNLRALAPVIARVAAFAAAAALGACITLFPKAAPSQLYRFDAQVQPPAASGPPVPVRVGVLDFDPASAGDAILTVTGDQVAYVQDGRWAIPASQLFEEAVEHGFSTPGGPARLVSISEASRAKLRLRLEVTHFETRYLNGPKAAPTVVVTLRATLNRQDGSLVGEQPFDASMPAGDDTVGAIVQAYDAAVSKVVGDLVAWVGQNGAA